MWCASMGMKENCPSIPVQGHMQKFNQAGRVAHGFATGAWAGGRTGVVRERHGMNSRGRLGVNGGGRVDILSA